MSEHKEDEFFKLPEAVRYERFLTAWERHLKAGLEPSQREADRIAAMYGVKANVAKKEEPRISVQQTAPVRLGRGRGD